MYTWKEILALLWMFVLIPILLLGSLLMCDYYIGRTLCLQSILILMTITSLHWVTRYAWLRTRYREDVDVIVMDEVYTVFCWATFPTYCLGSIIIYALIITTT